MDTEIIKHLFSSQLPGSSSIDIQKKEVVTLASYNWLERTTPTILVPGSPPAWTPKPLGTTLNQDSGRVFIDQNADRNPQYPLEPLFRALFTCQPQLNVTTIDLVTDRNNLRKLLRFISGSDDSFRINVERVGKTTLFTRYEENTSEIVQGFRGYGHQFEDAYTKYPNGMEDSTGHHRIITYELGGLRFIVRFEVDAYVNSANSTRSISKATEEATNNISELLKSVSLGKDKENIDTTHGRVGVIKGGCLVPPSSILEIKTRTITRRLDMLDVLPQLWISDTPKLVVGYHHRGKFDDVKMHAMDRGELEKWETSNARDLRRLSELLRSIIKAVENTKEQRCVVTRQSAGVLKVIRSHGTSALPKDIRERLEQH